MPPTHVTICGRSIMTGQNTPPIKKKKKSEKTREERENLKLQNLFLCLIIQVSVFPDSIFDRLNGKHVLDMWTRVARLVFFGGNGNLGRK